MVLPSQRSWLRRLGAKLFPIPLYVIYDGGCKMCRQVIAWARRLDVLGGMICLEAQDQRSLAESGLGEMDQAKLLENMHAICGKRLWIGYDAYRQAAWRLPLFWPLLPILYLWPVTRIGRRTYRRVADSRTCSIKERPKT